MTYAEYRKQEQEEYNKLPIFWAFSKEQFKQAMEERGLTENDTDKIYRFSSLTGGFYLKTDAPIIKAYFERPDRLTELLKNEEFVLEAFNYEMDNHEYAINHYQGDYDVLSCFFKCNWGEEKNYADYLTEAKHEELIPLYQQARKEHFKRAESWF